MARTLRIAVTAGEPAGIGPELLVRAAARAWRHRLIAIADPATLLDAAGAIGADLVLVPDDGSSRRALPAAHLAIQPAKLGRRPVPGRLDRRNAPATLAMLEEASAGALAGRYDALVTAPVHKSVLDRPEAPFSGHTEFFAERAGRSQVVMMLMAPGEGARPALRVALATTHLPLRAVPDAIRPAGLTSVLRVLHASLQSDYGKSNPRIAVLGLNPHAGESGHLGSEETAVIAPVLRRLRQDGMQLDGPLPADTAFTPARLANTDAFLAMYHDQGLPVLKYAGFGRAVNVTLGLPYVRTSVDHGTALDIAGQGKADPGSLLAAIEEAIRMALNRRTAA
jgi:4-hydroxythreonine-4-phosphate dehydrogenase